MTDSSSNSASEAAATLKALEKRVQDLETSLKVGIAIAVLLGASGGWLGSLVVDARKNIAGVREQAQTVAGDLTTAEAAARRSLETRSSELSAALDSRVSTAISDTLRKRAVPSGQSVLELSRRIGVLQHWLLLVYDKAADTGLPKHEGANGYWQKALIDSRLQAHADTVFKPLN